MPLRFSNDEEAQEDASDGLKWGVHGELTWNEWRRESCQKAVERRCGSGAALTWLVRHDTRVQNSGRAIQWYRKERRALDSAEERERDA